MKETPYRLCETDATATGNLRSTLAYDRDLSKLDTTVHAGEGGIRLWDNDLNEFRSFMLFMGCTDVPECSTKDEGEPTPRLQPIPVHSQVTNILVIANPADASSGKPSHILFTLWQHAQVFHAPMCQLDGYGDEAEYSVEINNKSQSDKHAWFFFGSRVCSLYSQVTTRERGEAKCLYGDDDGLVASGSECGLLSVWHLRKRSDREIEDWDDELHGQIDALDGECINDLVTVKLHGKKYILVGGEFLRIKAYSSEDLNCVLSIPCGFANVTSLSIGQFSTKDSSNSLLAAGFESGVISIWNLNCLIGEQESRASSLSDTKSGGEALECVLNHSQSPVTALISVPIDSSVNSTAFIVGTQKGELLLFTPSSTVGSGDECWALARATNLGRCIVDLECFNGNVFAITVDGVCCWHLAENESDMDNIEPLGEATEDALQIGDKQYDEDNTNDADPSADEEAASLENRLREVESQVSDETSEFEQPTPAPIGWVPKPEKHPLSKLQGLELPIHSKQNTAPIPNRISTETPKANSSKDLNRKVRTTTTASSQDGPGPRSRSKHMLEHVRLGTAQYRNLQGTRTVQVLNARESEASHHGADGDLPTCYDGFRDIDVPMLPPSVLHEPCMNSTDFLQHELAKLREVQLEENTKLRTKNRTTARDAWEEERQLKSMSKNHPNIDSPIRELAEGHGPRSAMRSEFRELVPIKLEESSDVVVVHKRRTVPPQVSTGWKYVPLMERLPELSKKYARRKQSTQDDDPASPADNSGDVPVPSSSKSDAQIRSSEQRSKPNKSPASSGRSDSSSDVSVSSRRSNVPWFYQQASHQDSSSYRSEFYLTRSDNGQVQFHNFHSLGLQ